MPVLPEFHKLSAAANATPVQLLIATTNGGKLAEFQNALGELPLQILSLAELVAPPKVTEDGASFEENALKKARTMADYSGKMTLADDSGLEVFALGGAPGIRSARYAGEEGNDHKNNEQLLRAMGGLPLSERGARFVCVIALCEPAVWGGRQWLYREECQGTIGFTPVGDEGFGYDPLFFYPPLGKTFAQLDRETKERVSHRGRAVRKLKEELPFLFPLRVKHGSRF